MGEKLLERNMLMPELLADETDGFIPVRAIELSAYEPFQTFDFYCRIIENVFVEQKVPAKILRCPPRFHHVHEPQADSKFNREIVALEEGKRNLEGITEHKDAIYWILDREAPKGHREATPRVFEPPQIRLEIRTDYFLRADQEVT